MVKIYEIKNNKCSVSYKILAGNEELQMFFKKNKDKFCKEIKPLFVDYGAD